MENLKSNVQSVKDLKSGHVFAQISVPFLKEERYLQ